MEQSSQSNNLKAFDLLRQAAREYNNAEYKFYGRGFFKFVREGTKTFLIEDIYIEPEFRGTPVANMILSDFTDYMRSQGILMYYGRVFQASKNFNKRIKTFESWGMDVQDDESLMFSVVSKKVEY